VLRTWLSEFVGEELLQHTEGKEGGFSLWPRRAAIVGQPPAPDPACAQAPSRDGGSGHGGTDPGPRWANGADPSAVPDRAQVVYLDTETTGLDPRADRLVLAGFAADDAAPVVLRHARSQSQPRWRSSPRAPATATGSRRGWTSTRRIARTTSTSTWRFWSAPVTGSRTRLDGRTRCSWRMSPASGCRETHGWPAYSNS